MKTSLGLVLAICLAGLQFVAIIVVVSSSYLTSERVLLDHARNLLSDVGTNTIAHSQGFLDPARGAAELAARLARNRVVASENTRLLEQLLFQQLQIAPQFAGVFYGDQDGNFVYVMRTDGPGPFRSKIISHDGGVRETELTWRNENFGIVERRPDPQDTYDPRARPWYIKAQAERGTIWTDPYIFFSAQTPGITIAAPVIEPNGEVQGVIGVDIEISAISDFLANLQIGENGTALIMNGNGDVIAHPDSEMLKAANADGTFRFAGIEEFGDPIARAAFGHLSELEFVSVAAETYAELSYDGADYVSTLMPIISAELPWTIAVYAPKSDFIGAILESRRQDVWVAAAIALVTGVVGLFLANYINKPVQAFAVRAALISQGEIDPSAPTPKTYKELERANEALNAEILQRKNSELEYGQTFELSSRGMVQVDPENGRFLRVNEEFADMFGYSVDEIMQMKATDFGVGDEGLRFPLAPGDGSYTNAAEFQARRTRKDGQDIWIKVNAILIRDSAGNLLHAVATIDDITKTVTAESQIRKLNRDLSHIARGELLGQIAAGLAHELNQPLTAITQDADAALHTISEREEPDDELVQILKDLDQQAHRAADIIKALRGFARKGEEWKSPLDLGDLIEQSLSLVRPEATENGVRIKVAPFDALPEVYGIRVQIAQVIVNLLRNAVEAIANSESETKKIMVSAEVAGNFVEVCVADSGPGVDPSLNLFTQFETTKSDGMGLGLSICKSIVEQGGGRIWLDTTYEAGARFCFTIPTTDHGVSRKT
ncbi:sensor histidine kinase [Yoonia sediminilitoris]|uniref:histidine kinase n=1 Tax=Yoonia sediminilitoris TaxID=1286148 RepID=A0A2T6K8E0_9RHOB|nr:cache domain-containing protein [Yoonia sediminilitoris]PUB11035.1 hypothetical protein C8N45_11518 [Yoonia sediminilitoris]RCW90954.1 hypothetical protein DFP92_11518 [Yoonia sediminilitoris]